MNEKMKCILIALAGSVFAWLVFALVYSLAREGVSFTQGLTNPLGIAVAIGGFVGNYYADEKKKANNY